MLLIRSGNDRTVYVQPNIFGFQNWTLTVQANFGQKNDSYSAFFQSFLPLTGQKIRIFF